MLTMIRVRIAMESDAADMVAFMRALSIEAPDTITHRSPPSVEEGIAFINRAAVSNRSFILLALDGDDVVGLLDFWTGSSRETCHAARFGMSVMKDRRNQGIGRKLVETSIARASDWEGFCRIEAEVAPWNAPALHLYEQLGFQREGRKSKALNIRGKPEDMLMMARTW